MTLPDNWLFWFSSLMLLYMIPRLTIHIHLEKKAEYKEMMELAKMPFIIKVPVEDIRASFRRMQDSIEQMQNMWYNRYKSKPTKKIRPRIW